MKLNLQRSLQRVLALPDLMQSCVSPCTEASRLKVILLSRVLLIRSHFCSGASLQQASTKPYCLANGAAVLTVIAYSVHLMKLVCIIASAAWPDRGSPGRSSFVQLFHVAMIT